MRKYLAMFAAGAMASVIPTTPALAAGSIVSNGDECVGFVPTPSGGFDPSKLLHTTDSHMVVNGGWATLSCHFDIPDELLPTKGVKADNVTCDIPGYGTATQTRMSASPGGRAVGVCRKKLPKN